MGAHNIFVVRFVVSAAVFAVVMGASPPPSPLASECSSSLVELSSCLSYVGGEAEAASEMCCESVTSIYDSKQVCLCYIVEEVYTDPSKFGVNSFNLTKLLRLPEACNIVGANATECIADLGLTPTSPGAAVFLSPPPSPPSTPTTAPPPPHSMGVSVRRALSIERLTMLALVVFLYVVPVRIML
ncbi:hypothetical protein Dimus_015266 [Dionaea muscipula]